jgi:hypothetical protein
MVTRFNEAAATSPRKPAQPISTQSDIAGLQ